MKQEKKIGIVLAVVIGVILVAILLYTILQPKPLSEENSTNIVKDANEGSNWLNELENNEMEQNLTAVTEEPEVVEPPTTENSTEVLPEPVADREEKAKEIAEATWGDMEGFHASVNTNTDAQGRYIVIIYANGAGNMITRYKVDVEAGTAEEF